jgi:hypothetical protein
MMACCFTHGYIIIDRTYRHRHRYQHIHIENIYIIIYILYILYHDYHKSNLKYNGSPTNIIENYENSSFHPPMHNHVLYTMDKHRNFGICHIHPCTPCPHNPGSEAQRARSVASLDFTCILAGSSSLLCLNR